MALSLVACGSAPPQTQLQDSISRTRGTRAAEYRIAFGDELDIRFFYNPELDELAPVRPDGRISLPLLGEIVAAGRTPSELTATLRSRYSAEMEDPEVTVIVRTFNSHRVYITGEVEEPGEVMLDTRLTALQAIARSGDFAKTARRSQVLLIRRRPYENQPKVAVLDLASVQKAQGFSDDLLLEPYDVLFVPKSRIANVNQFVDQYIKQVLPFDLGFRLDDILFDDDQGR